MNIQAINSTVFKVDRDGDMVRVTMSRAGSFTGAIQAFLTPTQAQVLANAIEKVAEDARRAEKL